MPTLFELPSELVLRVLAEVEPIDLLRFSQVCRSAYDTISHRVVWEEALRRIYRDNALFEPSFRPLASMDLDALRKAAMRPRLVHAALPTTDILNSCRETILNCGRKGLERDDFLRTQIVPGGRYVLGLAARYVSLWDVGAPGDSPPHEATLLHVAYIQEPGTRLFSLSMSNPFYNSRDSFRFLVYLENARRSEERIRVYEVGPLPEESSLRLVAELRLEATSPPLSRYWLSRDRVYIRRGSVFVVWDFVEASLVSWSWVFQGDTAYYDFVDVDDTVVSLHVNELFAWKVPELQPIRSPCPLEPNCNEVVNPPTCHSWYHSDAVDTSSALGKVLLPSKWTSFSTPTVVMLDLVAWAPAPARTSIVDRVRLEVSDGGSDIRGTILSRNEPLPTYAELYDTYIRPYSTCGNHVYLVAGSGSSMIWLHYLTSGSDDDRSGVVKCATGHPWEVCSLLCPYSGRLAYVCGRSHCATFNTIHVLDLFDV